MAKFSHPYLDLKKMEALRRVRLVPRGRTEGAFAGPHASHYRGSAVEFADFRDYAEGDDIRQVDWKVYARTDKHYVRLYESERNLLSYLVVDASGSMGYAGEVVRTPSKLEYAARLAAALGYLVVREGDELSLAVAGESVDGFLPPAATWAHLSAVVNRLGDARASGRTDLGRCLMDVYRRIVRRGVLIVLSDFLEALPPPEAGPRRAHGNGGSEATRREEAELWKRIDLFRQSRFDVLLLHVVHPEEIDLPAVPMARFSDPEATGKSAASFRAEPAVLREAYRQRFDRHLRTVEAAARSRGCDWVLARTDVDPYALLRRSLMAPGTGVGVGA